MLRAWGRGVIITFSKYLDVLETPNYVIELYEI
jgi:hypothetical protein